MITKNKLYNLTIELNSLKNQKIDIENKIQKIEKEIVNLEDKIKAEEVVLKSTAPSDYIIKNELNSEIHLEIDVGNYACEEKNGYNYIYFSEPQNITTLICNNMNILEINTSLLTNLKKIVCFNNKLENLNFFNNKEIQYVHCFNNPFINSDYQLELMIDSLPDRNNRAYGSLIINDKMGDRSRIDKVEQFAIRKDWLFGSPIMYIPAEWEKCKYNIRQINVADIWETAEYGKGRIIGVADTGFDYINPARCREYDDNVVYGSKYVPRDNYYGKDIATKPEYGVEVNHGNRVSTIICAKGVEFYGVAPKCQLYLMRVYNNLGANYLMELIFELNYIKDAKLPIDVFSYSFNSTKKYPALEMALKNFTTPKDDYLGIPFVNSAGNLGDGSGKTNEISYPASCLYPIVVGSINSENKVSKYSSSFKGVDLVSYGADIFKQEDYNTYKTSSGTSYSTPLIAGSIALLKTIFIKKYNRHPTENELYKELIKRTIPMDENPNQVGNGRFNFMAYNNNPIYVEKI